MGSELFILGEGDGRFGVQNVTVQFGVEIFGSGRESKRRRESSVEGGLDGGDIGKGYDSVVWG